MTTRERIELVMQLVAERSGVTVAEIKSRKRHEPLVWIRHVAMWIARGTPIVVFGLEFGCPNAQELKQAFNRLEHGSLNHAYRAVENQMSINPQVKAELEALRAEVLAAVADASPKLGCRNDAERLVAAKSILDGMNRLERRKNSVATR